jgi:glycosyltransferase involved in cell wall biosynthesis
LAVRLVARRPRWQAPVACIRRRLREWGEPPAASLISLRIEPLRAGIESFNFMKREVMRVLHVLKTSSGGQWAVAQVASLVHEGADVHVALPGLTGNSIESWRSAGATIHAADMSLPARRPWEWDGTRRRIRALVQDLAPDLIHVHNVTNAMAIRLALGPASGPPRIFQVPGPLHLEHLATAVAEMRSSGPADYWIATSRFTECLYRRQGLRADRLFLSYYGSDPKRFNVPETSNQLARTVDIPAGAFVVGNISWMYPPKYLLGQFSGLKRHEDIIDAIALARDQNRNAIGVLIGGEWGGGTRYRASLVERAARQAPGKVIFAEHVDFSLVPELWRGFDCAVHVPMSENCGGVVEPLAAAVPTIASRTGGLPEVVLEGLTGWLVPPRSPRLIAERILDVMRDPEEARRRALLGRRLVRTMFDATRTASEVAAIYDHILGGTAPPVPFSSREYVLATETCG